ncbi:MAG: hypothetical protein IKW78_03895 [Prevotella sp.]|nr:hypothetical protein [Prevotella sp.]
MNDLNLQSINATAPYIVGKVREGVFFFRTESDVLYSILFKPDMEIADSQTYQFVIDRLSGTKQGHGERVRDTIIAIIYDFFTQNNDILLYICDTDDGREAMRNRLFISWFTKTADSTRFTIKTANCQVEDQTFYTAIILQNTHPHYEAVTAEFDTLAEMYANKPQ